MVDFAKLRPVISFSKFWGQWQWKCTCFSLTRDTTLLLTLAFSVGTCTFNSMAHQMLPFCSLQTQYLYHSNNLKPYLILINKAVKTMQNKPWWWTNAQLYFTDWISYRVFYALRAYFRIGNARSFLCCFTVLIANSCLVRARRMALVFFGRRSFGLYFLFL